jgi:hypothetical protein
MQAMVAVTLSNENASSRSRAPRHPPPPGCAAHDPLAAARRPVPDRPHPPIVR